MYYDFEVPLPDAPGKLAYALDSGCHLRNHLLLSMKKARLALAQVGQN